MIRHLLDRISLRPTTHVIRTEGLRCQQIPVDGRMVELFSREVQRDGPEIHVLKFVGSSGRAENVTDHPFDAWKEARGALYVANPPGYGLSPGRASLAGHLDTAKTLYDWFCQQHPQQVPLLMGSSLGGAIALRLAADMPSRGLIVRDSPHLPEVIRSRYRFFAPFSDWFANVAEGQLDVISAARASEVPALFISSRQDRVVPPSCQDEVIDAYAGPKRVVYAEQADHMHPLQPHEIPAYLDGLQWLWESIQPDLVGTRSGG